MAFAAAGLSLALIAAATILHFAQNRPYDGRPVKIHIDNGSTPQDVADLMAGKGLVWNGYLFRLQIRSSGKAPKFKAGDYIFKKGATPSEIIDALSEGLFADKVITIPEGFSLNDIANRIEAKTGRLSASRFIRLASDSTAYRYKFLEGIKGKSLEGYLFPDTYAVDDYTTEESLIRKMLGQFQVKTAGLDWSRTRDIGYRHFADLYRGQNVKLRLKKNSIMRFTPKDIVIIASMIEREAKLPEEKPKVAAVIYNRLRNGWRLQIDATIIFAQGKHKKRLLFKDLWFESPYNTYRHRGLPPGPICSPGLDSIKAALHPATKPYFYYVADGTGGHVFTVKKSDFLKAKREMQLQRARGY